MAEPKRVPLGAVERVSEFVRQRTGAPGLEPDLIMSLWTDVHAKPAELLLSDLAALVREQSIRPGATS